MKLSARERDEETCDILEITQCAFIGVKNTVLEGFSLMHKCHHRRSNIFTLDGTNKADSNHLFIICCNKITKTEHYVHTLVKNKLKLS